MEGGVIMKKVSMNEQLTVCGGGTHYHWFCSVNRYVSAKTDKLSTAAYRAGVHAEKYNHGKSVSYGACTSSW